MIILRFMTPAVFAALAISACGGTAGVESKPCQRSGVLDCPCLTNETCLQLEDGTALVCEAGTCVQPTCDDGDRLAEGCLCGGAVECDQGLLCINGHCVEDSGQTLVPPPEPVCFTPCQGGGYVQDDGTYLACDHEGLLPGCVDGGVCVDGTCVRPQQPSSDGGACILPADCTTGQLCVDGLCVDGCRSDATCAQGESCKRGICVEDPNQGEPGDCLVDDQCPSFQACIANRCYSDCSADADCREGRSCFSHVCRVPCLGADASGAGSSADDNCPSGTYCHTEDGYGGFCAPMGYDPSGGEGSTDEGTDGATFDPDAGDFALSVDGLSFGPSDEAGRFEIINDSHQLRTFTVTKLEHTEYGADGATIIDAMPLHWLTFETEIFPAERVVEIQVEVDGDGGSAEIVIGNLVNETLPRWSGVLKISERTLGERFLNVDYTGSAEGRWAGRVFYMSNFGDLGLEEWISDRDDRSKLQVVGNALVRRWGSLRSGRLSLDEFRAVLTATVSESWRWKSVADRCPNEDTPNPNVACYLYDNLAGISVYSDFTPDNPVPTGVSDFPIVMNLHAPDAGQPGVWSGKIVSSKTLQYAGDPEVTLSFSRDPSMCPSCSDPDADPATCAELSERPCMNFITEFSAGILVGGRYRTVGADLGCEGIASSTYELNSFPWLVPGFEADTEADATGRRSYFECRDTVLPFGEDPAFGALNSSFAASNPVPDGSTRRREISLVDGAMIDQSTMLILFKESFPSFLDPDDTEGFATYGIMELQRLPTVVRADEYEGAAPEDYRLGRGIDAPGCTDDVLEPFGGTLDASNVNSVAVGLVQGLIPDAAPPAYITGASPERVHYWCEDTNHFDGGAEDDGSNTGPIEECPPGSNVQYFTLQGAMGSQSSIAGLACQRCDAGDPTCNGCFTTVQSWIRTQSHGIRMDPAWRCGDSDAVFCDTERHNLRSGKLFYADIESEALYPSLDNAVNEAFRYKTKFKNRSGTSVGFAPETCLPDSNQVPYCYDAAAMEEIQQRVDCAVHIYTEYYDDLAVVDSVNARSVLRDYLVRNFSFSEEIVFGQAAPVVHDGFERLYAELLIMLGDEASISAFKSRFDLAGQRLATFEGERFEPNGLTLSGGAGYEMYVLYQATQYYQLALDRFYRQGPILWRSLKELPPGQGFVTQGTVVSYFDRLIRASTQKTRAWSEIAKRYQSFNRPELARQVIERAYASAHLESVILSRMMLRTVELPNSSEAAQILHSVEQAQLTYRAAMMEMLNVYADVTDQVTFFGIPPDYIPFPAMYPRDNNAFEKMFERANQRLQVAREKEVHALDDDRSFETSSASFQAELAGITREYEGQLGEICGTFAVTNGADTAIYPAIPKYAALDERARLFGDPCGLMGTGALQDSMAQVELVGLDFAGLRVATQNIEAEVDDALERVNQQCARIERLRDFRLEKEDEIISINDTILGLRTSVALVDRFLSHFRAQASFAKCSVGTSSDCPTGAVASATYGVVSVVADVAIATTEVIIASKQGDLADVQREILERDLTEQCTTMEIDVEFTVKGIRRRALELEIEALKLGYNLKLATSNVEKLRNRALYLMAQQAESQELTINVEAARNDPNVRIYRNDAILAADRTFYEALVAAYRATKMYEYYTSQSYGPIIELQLVRMVSHGDFTLEAYLADLEQSFFDFEELYGVPDLRVSILSLRDDIFNIPSLRGDTSATDSVSRREQFVDRLTDVALLDANGYITIPFSTGLNQVSPLTRNHKVMGIEAEIIGGDVGDKLGRVYVRQRGTGVILPVVGNKVFFAFPERTAVIDAFFNGRPFFDRDVYRNVRLRDRPFVNTAWDMVINKKDESVNDDIALGSLTDVRLHIYYTDFTQL